MASVARVALLAAVTGAVAPGVAAADGGYARCAAPAGLELALVARVGCADVAAVVSEVASRPVADTVAALRGAGWSPLRAAQTRARAFDVVALRGRAVLRVRRRGAAPDLDGWAAGRELVLARPRLVGGKPVPRSAALCSSAFLVRWHGAAAGLTAAHCAGLRSDGTVERRYAALRRPPQPGIVLGRVRAVVRRHAPYDALLLPVPGGQRRPAAPTVDRGITRPPWIVAGFGRPLPGRRVCFSGRTSGADHCGRILGRSERSTQLGVIFRLGVLVVCTDIAARQGDSGGPVYTRARADGTVHAVGIVTLLSLDSGHMCFTPLGPVLDRLGARLESG